jgi:Lon protease-like protein
MRSASPFKRAIKLSGEATSTAPRRISAVAGRVKYRRGVASEIGLFPLPTPVLFPGATAPLHVFEPRYRALVADALSGERRIGMATVRPEAVAEMAGDPPLFAVGCAGFIAEHRQLADGRYLILLQATARFRILAEPARPAERLYRVARIELLGETLGDRARVSELRERVAAQLAELGAREQGDDFAELSRLEPERFASEVCQRVRLPALEKQALLEAASAEERLLRLAQTLDFYGEARARAGPTGSQTIH